MLIQGIRDIYPRTWPIWLAAGILWCLSKLPVSWQESLGKSIGRIIYLVGGRPLRNARINIDLCFPDLDLAARNLLVKQHFAAIGAGVLETALSWFASSEQLAKISLDVQGLEYLDAALQKGHGALICTPHFTSLEMAGKKFAEIRAVIPVYAKQKNNLFDKMAATFRSRNYPKIIEKHNMLRVVRELKQNKIVWYTPDIDPGEKHGVFAPFFNVPAATVTAPQRIAQLSKTAVIICGFYRAESLGHYEIIFSPPLDNFPSQDKIADAARINQALELMIRKKPEQYLWSYQRFKTRPQGERRFYSKNQRIESNQSTH